MKTKEEIKKEIYSQIKEYYNLYLSSKRDGVPVSGKKYDEEEIMSIIDAALDGWWTEGRVTEEFEKRFNEYLGTKYTIVVNSGSSANLLALKVLTSPKLKEKRLKPGDEIIAVAAAFPTTVNPIIECGCIPVFCDVDMETYNINIEQFKKAITPKTRAVFLAHTLGNPFNIEEIKKECEKHGLWFIEDSCDALGSKYNGKRIGTFGDISTFSFYPAHQITMGEGGALCTNNPLLSKIAKSIRDWGRDCWCGTGQDNTCKMRFKWKLGDLPYGYDHKYIYSEIGYNLKNTDLNVAIGLSQLDKLEEFVRIRKENFNLLSEKLCKFDKYFYLPRAEENSDPSWFGFLITLKENCNFNREELIEYLNENKIGTRLLFSGNVTKQPYFIDNKINYRVVDNLTNTDKIMKDTFWIGVCPLISRKDVEYVVEKIGSFIKEH
ncbi:MAG: lipopolysaccharide biosynthesis protein RfbH [Nanoarchaeota archaeon]|nr:lipopolysaccharide biosynthesis protein RfbH [Nanoarchaeota archaeon]